ncbi:MAG: hypothetical protein K8S54_17880 [Spirochaetia bacterium]|nr:hypothetical protein [Spirochaetia bacterium]
MSEFSTLRIIHGAICSGPLVFLIVTYFTRTQIHSDPTLPYACLALGVGSVILSLFLPQILPSSKSNPPSANSGPNIAAYRVRKIVQWGVVESGALANVVAYFISGLEHSLAASIALVLWLAYLRPKPEELQNT